MRQLVVQPRRGHDVHERLGRAHRLVGVREGLPRRQDLGLGPVRQAREARQRLLGRREHRFRREREEVARVPGLVRQGARNLVERRDADQAVPLNERTVEEAERQSRNERVYPEGQPRELDRHRVDVHAVDAPPRYLASQ